MPFSDKDIYEAVRNNIPTVSAYVNSHGGDIKLLGVKDNIVYIELLGTCKGCAMSVMTTKMVVQKELRLLIHPTLHIINVDGTLENKLPNILKNSDIFIFASSCENMPNTLIEAMASGLPIACSNRGPMPEILKDAGVYFDPENPTKIVNSLKKLITNENYRKKISKIAMLLSTNYSWQKCSKETFAFLSKTFKNYQSINNE